MTSRTALRLLGAGAALVLGATVVPGLAFAHIEPDPSSVPAGSRQSIGFVVEHGCDESPTVQADMRLPDGLVDPVASGPDGWSAGIVAGVVTWSGPAMPADREFELRLEATMPLSSGAKLYFPIVQRCDVGEIRWIGTDEAPSDEPAPAMVLTEALPGSDSSVAVPSSAVASTSAPAASVATSAAETVVAGTEPQVAGTEPLVVAPAPTEASPASTVTVAESDAPASPAASSDTGGSDGGSSAGLIAGVVAALVAVVGGAWWLRSRR